VTLSPELRQSIIIQVQKGKQYREIAKELNISVGSITNTVKNHHKRSTSERRLSKPSDIGENATLCTDFSMNNSAGSLLLNGIRKAAPSVKECALPEANPLEKGEDSRKDIDFADTAYQDFYPNLEVEVNNMSQTVNNAPSEPLITSESDIDFDNISYPVFYPAAEVLGAEKREIEEGRMGLDAEKKAFEEETEEIRTHMRQKVSSDKYLLKHESLIIERKRKGLNERMFKVEQKERDLVIREGEIMEAEPFLSLARRLQNTDMNFDALLPLGLTWIKTVNEVALRRGMDITTAATYINQEFKSLLPLGGVQAQLEMINKTIMQKQKDLSTLAELQKNGISLDVIYAVSKILDLKRMATEWDPLKYVSNGHNGGVNNGHSVLQN